MTANGPIKVKKDGPNNGREFYNCKDGNCKFFVWKDMIESPEKTIKMEIKQEPQIERPWKEDKSSDCKTKIVDKCWCGKTCTKLTVKSETRNKGRLFYKCYKCDYFAFADEGVKSFGTPKRENKPAQSRSQNVAKFHNHDTTDKNKDIQEKATTITTTTTTTTTTIAGTPNQPEIKKRADPKCSSCGRTGHNKTKCKFNGK